MSQVSVQDIEAIKDWVAKQPYLHPQDFDELTIKKFIFACHNSLERTKKCIEEFSTRRANLPELFTNRDPTSKKMHDMLSATSATTYFAGDDEVLIHRVNEVVSNFDMNDCLKAFAIQADNWILLERDVQPNGQIVVLDIELYTIALVARVNIFFIQKFFIYLLESMPLRLAQVHVVNCPSFYEYLYSIVKPALPEYIRKMIHFHPDHTGLHKFVDKKYLPIEYGGECQRMSEQQAMWITDLSEKRKIFLNDNLWKADLSKKENSKTADNTMSGSFRTLAID